MLADERLRWHSDERTETALEGHPIEVFATDVRLQLTLRLEDTAAVAAGQAWNTVAWDGVHFHSGTLMATLTTGIPIYRTEHTG